MSKTVAKQKTLIIENELNIINSIVREYYEIERLTECDFSMNVIF